MTRLVASLALAFLVAACSNQTSPLVGTWSTTEKTDGIPIVALLTVSDDGDVSVTIDGSSQECTGALTETGQTWSATATTITLSGEPTCSGTISCDVDGTAHAILCADVPFLDGSVDTASYSLTDDQTLNLTLGGGDAGAATIITLTRLSS